MSILALAVALLTAAPDAWAGQAPARADAARSDRQAATAPSVRADGPATLEGPASAASEPGLASEQASPAAPAPQTSFPEWRLMSMRSIDPQLRPNAGIRVPMGYRPIKNGPLLYPGISATAPDFNDPRVVHPWLVRASAGLFSVDNERESSKFQEFRDVDDGVTAGVEARYRKDRTTFNLIGKELGRDDQSLNMDAGLAGKLRWSLQYDQIPHNFAFGAKSLYSGVGTDKLTVADAIQTDLQNSATIAELSAKAGAYVAQQGVAIDESLRRDKIGTDVTLLATYPWLVTAGYSNESRDGIRPFSASFGTSQFDELPWPVKYDTHDTHVNAEWARPGSRFYAGGGFRYSDFVNHYGSFVWDNPFRITDAPNPAINNALVGPATGRMGLNPSNQYSEASGTVVVKRLPLKSTLNTLVSFGYMRQDEQLIPFSTNTAAVDTLSSPVSASFAATDPSGLPRQTAKTAMDTHTVHARWSADPTSRIHLAAQYRLNQLVNHEEPFTFFMFVREDQDRRLPETQPGGTYGTVAADYTRQSATAEAAYNLGHDGRVGLTYTFDRMDRDQREVERMNDNKITVTADSRHLGWVELKSWYTHTSRTTSPYDFAQYYIGQGTPSTRPMLPWLQKFDEAPYTRNEAQVMATVPINDATSVSAHMQIVATDYHPAELGARSKTLNNVTAPADPNYQFGVQSERRYSYGVDVTYTPNQRLNLFADAGYDQSGYVQGARQWSANGISDPYLKETTPASLSNWTGAPRDKYWSGGGGVDASLIPDRLHVNVQYTYSRSDGRQTYNSPVGVAAVTDVNAWVPMSFNDVDDITWQTFNPEVDYTLNRTLVLSAGYYREKWKIDDYNYKGFTYAPLYTTGVALLMGGLLPPGYDVNVAYVRVRIGF